MGEGLLTQRSLPDHATRHPHLPPKQNCVGHCSLGLRMNFLYADNGG